MLQINKFRLTLFINKLKTSTIVSNTMYIAMGNIIAQILSFVFIFVNGRLYGPEYYGDFGLFTSTYTIVNGLVTLGLISAILTPKEDEIASGIYKIVLLSVIILSTLFFLLVISFSPWLKIINISIDYFIVCILIVIVLITNNLVSMISAWANRKQAYKLLLWNPILTGILNFLVSFIIAFTDFKVYGLMLGTIVSQIGSYIYMRFYLKPLKYRNSIFELIGVLKKYSDFPKYQMLSNFIKGISSSAPILLMGTFFGNSFIGQYNMGQRLLFIPIVFIGSALGQVHFKLATDMVNSNNDPGELTYKVIKSIMIICFFPFLIFGLIGDNIFKMFLGDNWIISGEISKIRALEFLYTSMFFSTSYIFVVIKKQKLSLLYTITSLLLNLIVVYLGGGLIKDSKITVILISTINIVLYAGFYIYAFKYTTFGVKPYLKLITVITFLFIVLQLLGNFIF